MARLSAAEAGNLQTDLVMTNVTSLFCFKALCVPSAERGPGLPRLQGNVIGFSCVFNEKNSLKVVLRPFPAVPGEPRAWTWGPPRVPLSVRSEVALPARGQSTGRGDAFLPRFRFINLKPRGASVTGTYVRNGKLFSVPQAPSRPLTWAASRRRGRRPTRGAGARLCVPASGPEGSEKETSWVTKPGTHGAGGKGGCGCASAV